MNDKNPRKDPRHKERSYTKYYYTYVDIAEVLGVSVDRVRHLKSEGKLEPASLKSIINYICHKEPIA